MLASGRDTFARGDIKTAGSATSAWKLSWSSSKRSSHRPSFVPYAIHWPPHLGDAGWYGPCDDPLERASLLRRYYEYNSCSTSPRGLAHPFRADANIFGLRNIRTRFNAPGFQLKPPTSIRSLLGYCSCGISFASRAHRSCPLRR